MGNQCINLYDLVAYKEGRMFSIWGPCSDGTVSPCHCPQCQHADALEREGLDYNEEYEKMKHKEADHG